MSALDDFDPDEERAREMEQRLEHADTEQPAPTTQDSSGVDELRERIEKVLYPDNLVNPTYTRLTNRPLTNLLVELVATEKAESYKKGYIDGVIETTLKATLKEGNSDG